MILVGILLFLGACVGHTALLAFSLNRFFGVPFPRKVLRVVRSVHGLLVLAGPVVFSFAFLLRGFPSLDSQMLVSLRSILAVYGLFCCGVAFVLLPALTLLRRLRGRPAVLVSNHTRTVDVAADLNYPPIGQGKYQRLARLPLNEIFRVDFAERLLRLPQLPAEWEGLSILHLSDLHLCGTPDREFYHRVMDLCREWEPDLVALTGDVVDTDRHHRWILPVLGRLRWRVGAFAILGNHDRWYEPGLVRRRLRRAGIHVLGNTWEQIEVRGRPLVVIGHEGPWFPPAPDLSGCPAGVFRLCLSHTPDNIAWARAHGIDLMLAGHNHGGQIRFPLIGSVLVPSRYSRRYDCGTFHEPPTVLHVSRGLAGQHPIRYNCHPEVTKIILTRA